MTQGRVAPGQPPSGAEFRAFVLAGEQQWEGISVNAALPEHPLKATDLLLKEDSLRIWIGTFKIPSFPDSYLILHKKRSERCLISIRGKKKNQQKLFQMYNDTSL